MAQKLPRCGVVALEARVGKLIRSGQRYGLIVFLIVGTGGITYAGSLPDWVQFGPVAAVIAAVSIIGISLLRQRTSLAVEVDNKTTNSRATTVSVLTTTVMAYSVGAPLAQATGIPPDLLGPSALLVGALMVILAKVGGFWYSKADVAKIEEGYKAQLTIKDAQITSTTAAAASRVDDNQTSSQAQILMISANAAKWEKIAMGQLENVEDLRTQLSKAIETLNAMVQQQQHGSSDTAHLK